MADDFVAWTKVCRFMQQHCAVVLSSDQVYLMEARLGEVARAHKFATIAAFVDASVNGDSHRPATKALIDAMTTHESSFFRDPVFWQGLQDKVQDALKLSQASSLRIWSSACSHGQEVYSLLMWLEEQHPKLAARTSIVANDISEAAVERGRAGIYSSLEINRGLTATRMLKHFEKAPGGFRVRDHLRGRVQWSVHNLMDPPPAGGPFDVVLCRNVLIYFDPQDRKGVLARLMAATRPQGFIGLGTGESHLQPFFVPGWYQRPSDI